MAIDRLRIPDGRDPITSLLYGSDELIANWVAIQLKQPLKTYQKGMYRAIGIIKNDIIIGGVIWSNYQEDFSGRPLLIESTIATIDKMWCSRHNLQQLFYYPFCQLGVKRVQATCSKKAKRVRSTLERLGYKLEGVMRQGCPYGGDATHYSMLKSECKWINNGKINAFSTSAARPSKNISGTNAVEQRNRPLSMGPE